MEAITETKLDVQREVGIAAPKAKSKGRIRKILWRGLLALLVIAAVAQLSFTYSGSGEWQSLGEKNGTTAYSMKTPGSNLLKFKGVTRVHTSLTRVVAFMQDDTGDLNIGFYPSRLLDKQSDQLSWKAFRIGFPKPFKDREFVAKHSFTQDPTTKVVTYLITAAPDMLEPEACCINMPRINNSWVLTPVDKDTVDIQWIMDMDLGGQMPYLMPNGFLGDLVYSFMPALQGYFDDTKYDNVKVDWMTDPYHVR
jgi:hypothetical protein